MWLKINNVRMKLQGRGESVGEHCHVDCHWDQFLSVQCVVQNYLIRLRVNLKIELNFRCYSKDFSDLWQIWNWKEAKGSKEKGKEREEEETGGRTWEEDATGSGVAGILFFLFWGCASYQLLQSQFGIYTETWDLFYNNLVFSWAVLKFSIVCNCATWKSTFFPVSSELK